MAVSGNHSCEPNAEVTFPYNNSTLALKALHSIQPEEVRKLSLNCHWATGDSLKWQKKIGL